MTLLLAWRAAKRFARELYDLGEDELASLSPESVSKRVQKGQTPFEALQATVKELDPERATHIDKVPFARTVVDLLPELAEERRARHNAMTRGWTSSPLDTQTSSNGHWLFFKNTKDHWSS